MLYFLLNSSIILELLSSYFLSKQTEQDFENNNFCDIFNHT